MRQLGETVLRLGERLRRFQVIELVRRHEPTPVLATFSFVNGCLSIGVMAVAALATGAPVIFPSLGPTAFLHFYTPTVPAACPRNTLCGHLIGALAGWASLVIFGLLDAPPALVSGVDWARAGAAALSLGTTSGLMVLGKVPHPPAGATTLIISLGIMPHFWQIPVLMMAVAALTVQAFVINRLAGVPFPVWSPLPAGTPGGSQGTSGPDRAPSP